MKKPTTDRKATYKGWSVLISRTDGVTAVKGRAIQFAATPAEMMEKLDRIEAQT